MRHLVTIIHAENDYQTEIDLDSYKEILPATNIRNPWAIKKFYTDQGIKVLEKQHLCLFLRSEIIKIFMLK